MEKESPGTSSLYEATVVQDLLQISDDLSVYRKQPYTTQMIAPKNDIYVYWIT